MKAHNKIKTLELKPLKMLLKINVKICTRTNFSKRFVHTALHANTFTFEID